MAFDIGQAPPGPTGACRAEAGVAKGDAPRSPLYALAVDARESASRRMARLNLPQIFFTRLTLPRITLSQRIQLALAIVLVVATGASLYIGISLRTLADLAEAEQ